jgi:hypothetical protein
MTRTQVVTQGDLEALNAALEAIARADDDLGEVRRSAGYPASGPREPYSLRG